jgi:hypothetical protein
MVLEASMIMSVPRCLRQRSLANYLQRRQQRGESQRRLCVRNVLLSMQLRVTDVLEDRRDGRRKPMPSTSSSPRRLGQTQSRRSVS